VLLVAAAVVIISISTAGATTMAVTIVTAPIATPAVVFMHYARAKGEATENEQRKNATKQERNHS
jgi:beta-lactam-binding protein with PASTA domain